MINHFKLLFSGAPQGAQRPRKSSGAQSRLPKLRFGMALCTAFVLLPSLASAQQMLTLKGVPTDADGRVTVGDVFDNAGPLAGVVLGYRNGPSTFLDAATVQSVVGANGGYWANPRGQRRIIITAGADGGASAPAPVAMQRVAQPPNPFGATPAAAMPAPTAPFANIPVAAVPAPASPATAARGPVVVHRSETIDVTWSAAGLSLTMSGIAQKDAAAGEAVAVQNPTSKKMIDAVIIGPGHAVAGPDADRYRNAALQLSSR